MQQRISIRDLQPEAYKAMFGLENYLHSTGIDKKLKELIKVRASQINGCAYCIQLHAADARKAGETEQRIYALSAWWETPIFTEQEKVVLAMTDEITRIAEKGLSEQTYKAAKKIFNDNNIAQIIMQISIINTWNRIAIATHMFHPPAE
ncbi:carboxymuconolactone decarboxylase family protein [Leptospira ilyithenensis]|uniref:Carboxymuconolactone decarboxylase family protein n=1 Tax=Leptospira ilyithenensis TaxID=2484901 RepID=A0A4R9LJR5_9LEPT|nr:carboxymuconolactone decarboxylase family protein [Leptospira ilyithenensis]TGN07083.1 carboxymuconolactone decarboxylase family protein [Leptospira ilyithenensis]